MNDDGWDGLIEAMNIAVTIARLGLGDSMRVSYSPDGEYTNSDDIEASTAALFSTGEWTSEMGDIVYPGDEH